MKATLEVPEYLVPAGWVIGGPTDLLDVWSPSPLVLRAPRFSYGAHYLEFELDHGTTKPGIRKRRWLSLSERRAVRLAPSEIVYDARFDATDNVAHILQNQTAVVITALQQLGMPERLGDVRVLVHPNTPRYALDLYATLGFAALPTDGPVTGQVLSMRPWKFPRRAMAAPALRTRAVELGLLSDSDESTGALFLARRGRRALTNQTAIEPLLNQAGYETVFAEDLEPAEQIRRIANASHLFGLHGAALGYVMLSKPGRRAFCVEAFSGQYASNWARANCVEVGTQWLGAQGVLVPSTLTPKATPRQFEGENYALHPDTVRVALELRRAWQQGGDLSVDVVDASVAVLEKRSRQ